MAPQPPTARGQAENNNQNRINPSSTTQGKRKRSQDESPNQSSTSDTGSEATLEMPPPPKRRALAVGKRPGQLASIPSAGNTNGDQTEAVPTKAANFAGAGPSRPPNVRISQTAPTILQRPLDPSAEPSPAATDLPAGSASTFDLGDQISRLLEDLRLHYAANREALMLYIDLDAQTLQRTGRLKTANSLGPAAIDQIYRTIGRLRVEREAAIARSRMHRMAADSIERQLRGFAQARRDGTI